MQPEANVLAPGVELAFTVRERGGSLLIEELDERMNFSIPLSAIKEKYVWYRTGDYIQSAQIKLKDGRELIFDGKLFLITDVPYEHVGPVTTTQVFELREHLALVIDFVRNREKILKGLEPAVATQRVVDLLNGLLNAKAVGWQRADALIKMLNWTLAC